MTQPNIIVFLIDDLGWRDLACYGSSFYETPNLDRLARQGMQFTNAYASCPVCSPTRASIMSGKYPARVGVTQFIGGHNNGKLKDVPYLHYLPQEETSVASALRDGGYQTWHIGKWHLGDAPFYPEKHGFDINIGGFEWGAPKNGYFSPWGMHGLPDAAEGTYLTDHLTDHAVRLLEERNPDRPFFMDFSHYAVHTPLQAPEHLVEKYRRKAERMHLDAVDPIAVGETIPKVLPDGRQPPPVKRRLFQSHPVYAAMVESMDTSIGRVLDKLDAEGLTDNTLVVFTSDNGGLATAEGSPTCNLPLAEGKGWNYEGGTRVCQIMRWPSRIPAHTLCRTPVTSTDFYPTFLEAAQLPLRPAQHCDGISLMPLLEQTGELDREAIFWHYPHYANQGGTPAASVVCGRWKLIQFFEDDHLELYDIEDDISEARDLAAVETGIAKRLKKLLADWQEDVEAKFPEPNPDAPPPQTPETPNNAHV